MDSIPKREQLPGYKDYWVKLLHPWKLSYYRRTEVGVTLYESMCKTPLMLHWIGPEFWICPNSVIRQSIEDPRKRLQQCIDEASKHRKVVLALGRFIHESMLSPRVVAWGLFTKNEYNENIMIGFSLWKLPSYMKEDLDQFFHRDHILFKLYKWLTILKFRIIDFFAFFKHNGHPFRNNRLDQVSQKRTEKFPLFKVESDERGDQLATKTYDQLQDEVYRPKDTVFLGYFGISNEYQRKGLGGAFFNYMLDKIPNRSTPFVSQDGEHATTGPQKVCLNSTEDGIEFYKRQGMTVTCDFDMTTEDGIHMISARMDMAR